MAYAWKVGLFGRPKDWLWYSGSLISKKYTSTKIRNLYKTKNAK
jgi:hypothetical protein